ncbi:Conserved_hypothetical protein [Hexamita inflata]|uniref:Uncharacterized protein n=1 Tax=Hexamita inflata TaxID=28002 RepID=A0AA86PNH4_9EUKA|nr:Conserved hypothetical protein [Hexamita inflata]
MYTRWKDAALFHILSIILFSYQTCANFHSVKYWVTGVFAAYFQIIYHFLNTSKQHPSVEQEDLQYYDLSIKQLFNKHYENYIQHINQEIQTKVVVITIRTNLNQQISETVKFTRLIEQLCKMNQVKIIQVSSQVFQFFVQEDSVQKMLQGAVKICSGAKSVVGSLGVTVSAGIAFGDIELVTQIFGNLQYKCFYGDVIEISDLISQQSFDEIRVELTSLIDKEDRFGPNIILDELRENVPTFSFSVQVDTVKYKQQTLQVTSLMVNEIKNTPKLVQEENQYDHRVSTFTRVVSLSQFEKIDSSSLKVYENDLSISSEINNTPISDCSDQIPILPIFKIVEANIVSVNQYRTQINTKNILSKTLLRFSSYKNLIPRQQYKLINIELIIYLLFGLTQKIGIIFNLQVTFSQIEKSYGTLMLRGYTPICNQTNLFKSVLKIDIVVTLLCLILFIYLLRLKNKHQTTITKLVQYFCYNVLGNMIFIFSLLYSFIIQQSIIFVFDLLRQYHSLEVTHSAVAHGWLMIFYSNFNLMQQLNISIYSPQDISRNIKLFGLMEIVNLMRISRKYPQYALFMFVSQASQIPWLLQQASIGVNNIGTKIKMRDYIKKQAVILSRHRPHLQASGELLIITKDQPTLNQDVIGQLNVKYQSVKYHESASDLVNRIQTQLKDQLPHFPVVLFNNAVVLRLDFPTRPVEETNCLFADVTNAFSSREHLSLLSSSRNAARWISYHEKNDANSAYWHLQLALYNVLEVLHRHPEAGAALSFGDLKGVTLCYEDVRHDAVGEAAEELEQIVSAPGRLTVSKRFWAQFVQRALENCGGQKQNLQFQKQFVDGGNFVQLWK